MWQAERKEGGADVVSLQCEHVQVQAEKYQKYGKNSVNDLPLAVISWAT